METTTNGLWRYSVNKDNLSTLLKELLAESIIFPFELDYLEKQIKHIFDAEREESACFISGMYKDVVILPAKEGEQQYDVVINRNSEKIDHITLLPSKYALHRQLDIWLREGDDDTIIALLIIELDEFSKINDVLDHSVGDLLLFQLARRLETYDDLPCKVVRLHGDEFAIAVTGLSKLEQIWDVSSWIEQQFSIPFDIEGETIYLCPSVGMSAIPYSATTPKELVRTAFFAVNKAKQDVSQQSHYYESRYAEQLKENLKIETDLHNTLRDGVGLEAYYQPKQSLVSNKIEGIEALIRWQHPVNGLVSPGMFITVAEESELICQISDFIIHQVCKDIPTFRKHGYEGQVSINISARDFARADFIGDVVSIVKQHGISPSEIELEITEGAFISDFDHCCVVLTALRAIGFSVSIDDFGTGYSSLSYLRKLPVDVLKIDMSFVQEIEHSESVHKIFAALIDIGKALSLKIVAEGVDNEAQRETLRQMKCDLIQGYLLSKPVALDTFCQTVLKK
jgi:diguanylate cyclase (GGDEF)-like protein